MPEPTIHVQILYLAASHMNCLHFGVAVLFQMAPASAKNSVPSVSIPYAELTENTPEADQGQVKTSGSVPSLSNE
jgi:hypothetical protein